MAETVETTTEQVEQQPTETVEKLAPEELERKLHNKTEEAARVHKNLEETQKKLKAYEEAEEKKKLDELSEIERMKAEKAQLEAKLTEQESKFSAKERENKIIALAHKHGFADVNDAVLFTKEGEGETLDAAVERLAKEKQYLIKKETRQAGNIHVDAATAEAASKAKGEEFLKRMGLRRSN